MRKQIKDELFDRGVSAAARYLELKGYEVIDRDYACVVGDIDLVAADEFGSIHFIVVDVSRHGFPSTPKASDDNRCRLELRALSWLRDHQDHVDVELCFDWIAICVVSENRAMLKHSSNFLRFEDYETLHAAATEHADAVEDDSGDEAA